MGELTAVPDVSVEASAPTRAFLTDAEVVADARAAFKTLRRVHKAPAGPRPVSSVDRVLLVQQRLREEGMSPRTVHSYFMTLRRVDTWCDARGRSLLTLQAEDLAAFAMLVPNTHSSQRIVKVSLGHYWRILGRDNPPLWVIRVPGKPAALCKALTEDEARTLVRAARSRRDRKGLAVMLGMHLGLRREEIATLRRDAFTDEGWINIVGKGNKSASLPVHPDVLDLVGSLDRQDSPWVFPGRYDGPVGNATIWNWVREVAEEAGVENVTTHRLRHTALAEANDILGDLRAVQAFARHSKPETTAGYTRTTAKRLGEVMMAISYEDNPEMNAKGQLGL